MDASEAMAIEPWVQEPERCSTCRKAVVVKQRDYACYGLYRYVGCRIGVLQRAEVGERLTVAARLVPLSLCL